MQRELEKNRGVDGAVVPQEYRSGRAFDSFTSSLTTFPVLGALAVIVGIALERMGTPFLTVFSAFTIAVLIGFEAWRAGRPGSHVALIGLLVAALLPAAHLRSGLVERTPDGLAGLEGKPITLQGVYDGRFFSTQQGRVAVSPRDALTAGRWRVTGRLEAPQWNRNFGTFDYGAWLERRGVRHVLRVRSSRMLEDASPLERVRDHLRAGLSGNLPPANAAFMQSLVLGETDDLMNQPEPAPGLDWRDAFSRSGLAHVLALSGQQVTILLVALGFALGALGVWRYPALMVFLGAYVLVVGPSPSIMRAALMGAAVLLSLWLGRGRLEIMPALGLSVILTLLSGPRWLFDLGWQLSHLAVLGLAVFLPPVARALKRFSPLPRASRRERLRWWVVSGACLTLATTVAAQLATLPLSASSFGIVPSGSFIANLLAGPLVALLVPLGFLAATLGPGLGAAVNLLVAPLSQLTLETARVFSGWPVLTWGTISAFGFVAYFAFLTVLALACWNRVRWSLAFGALLVAALITALPGARPHAEIVYLDVGQGDATLIRLPNATILVDGGGSVRSDFDVGKRVVVPALRALGVRNLTAVIATHADVDHIEGLSSVLRAMPVGVLLIGFEKPGDAVWDDLQRTASAQSVPIQHVRRSQVWHIGQARLEFLHPGWKPAQADNDNSVAFRLEYGRQRTLFLGDAAAEVESQLRPGSLEVLKVAHHGSRFSTSETLLERSRPDVAIISSGVRNTYGHPARDVLNRLSRFGVRVYRTDRDGAIRYDLQTGAITVAVPNPQTGQPGAPGGRSTSRLISGR